MQGANDSPVVALGIIAWGGRRFRAKFGRATLGKCAVRERAGRVGSLHAFHCDVFQRA